MWYVYVIKHSETGELYIGQTDDLKRRLSEHNHGQQTATKRLSGLWYLVYSEQYRNKQDAVIRERRLKHHGRAKQELYRRIRFSLGN